jgi:hypothetical protein
VLLNLLVARFLMFRMQITVHTIIVLYFRILAIFVANKLVSLLFFLARNKPIVKKEIYKHGYLDLYKLTQLL